MQIGKKWFDVKMSAMPGEAELELYNDIGMYGISAKEVKAQIDALGAINQLTVRINSYGGDVLEGTAIYNMIKTCEAKTVCYIDGIAASIASYIAMACKEIKMYDNAFMMIHNPWVMTAGDSEQLRNNADLLDKMKENAIKAYLTHAKYLSESDVSEMMDSETWMNAEEAKEWGFVDEVINPTENQTANMRATVELPRAMLSSFVKFQRTLKKPVEAIEATASGDASQDNNQDAGSNEQTTIPNTEEGTMPDKVTTVQDLARETEIREAAIAEAKARSKEVFALCEQHKIDAKTRDAFLDSKKTVAEIGLEILNRVYEKTSFVKPVQSVEVLSDETDSRRAVMTAGLMVGLGKGTSEDEKALAKSSVKATSIHNLVKECLIAEGVSPIAAMRLNGDEILQEACRMGNAARVNSPKMQSTSSSDLTSVLADVQNKIVTMAYRAAPVTFDAWCDEREVKDFKSIKFPKLTMIETLKKMPEGSPAPLTKFSDKQETTSLDTYGLSLILTRQSIINDDMGLLGDTSLALGDAARRSVNQGVYDYITASSLTGPTMNEDGLHLFDATATTGHGNIATTAAIPSTSTVAIMSSMIRKQKGAARTGETGGVLNWPARFLISGSDQEHLIFQLTQSQSDPTASINAAVPNFVKANGIIGVTDGYLQTLLTAGSKGSAWYMSTDKINSPIVVCYLNGLRTPTIRGVPSEVGEALGLKFDCFFDFAIAAKDWRGIAYNAGS